VTLDYIKKLISPFNFYLLFKVLKTNVFFYWMGASVDTGRATTEKSRNPIASVRTQIVAEIAL
jgi:hypothetical protein